MGDERFSVRWKGKELGRFTRTEIVSRLLSREWSVHYEVNRGQGWCPAGDFLQEDPVVEAKEQAGEQEVRGEIWFWSGYLSLLALGGVLLWLLILGERGWVWVPALAVFIGLVGSACGLTILAQGRREHGLVLIGGSVGLALAIMVVNGAS